MCVLSIIQLFKTDIFRQADGRDIIIKIYFTAEKGLKVFLEFDLFAEVELWRY